MLYGELAELISAEEAARKAGLRFKGNRAFCPWHDDGRHPALAFRGQKCYCHACHRGGDAIDLYAAVYHVPMRRAARMLAADFGIDFDGNATPDEMRRIELARVRQRDRKARKMALGALYSRECDEKHAALRNADKIESQSGARAADISDFWNALATAARADERAMNMNEYIRGEP